MSSLVNPLFRVARKGDERQIVDCIISGFSHLTNRLSRD